MTPPTYEMMQKADTIGVFQIESRAQMATLPRLKPKCFYDVVIEVAIIRPGPIQGDMVHPYLARRAGREEVTYFDPTPRAGAGTHPRRAVVPGTDAEDRDDHGRFFRRRSGGIAARAQFSSLAGADGQSEREIARRDGAKQCRAGSDREDHCSRSRRLRFMDFPESHAISFAILAYGSAYLKVHRAPEFYASLLNNQPMGFYTPATIVKDAQPARDSDAAGLRERNRNGVARSFRTRRCGWDFAW